MNGKPRRHQYKQIVALFEAGYTCKEGAKILGIPHGTFTGTIGRLRKKGWIIERNREGVDERHTEVARKVTLPKLSFMEDK